MQAEAVSFGGVLGRTWRSAIPGRDEQWGEANLKGPLPRSPFPHPLPQNLIWKFNSRSMGLACLVSNLPCVRPLASCPP